jgi:hypothetical protein
VKFFVVEIRFRLFELGHIYYVINVTRSVGFSYFKFSLLE